MSGKIILTDSGETKEVSAAAHRQGVANAYAQFDYGSNGLDQQEARELAHAAAKQQALENKVYGK